MSSERSRRFREGPLGVTSAAVAEGPDDAELTGAGTAMALGRTDDAAAVSLLGWLATVSLVTSSACSAAATGVTAA